MDYFFIRGKKKKEIWYWVSVNQKKNEDSFLFRVSICLSLCIMLSPHDPIINKAINQVGAFN